jgi:hypothetical protein
MDLPSSFLDAHPAHVSHRGAPLIGSKQSCGGAVMTEAASDGVTGLEQLLRRVLSD